MNASQDNKNVINKNATAPNKQVSTNMPWPIRTLVRRRWQLLACMLVATSVAFAATILCKEQFEATARVQVSSEPAAGGMAALLGGGSNNQVATFCQLLQSRHVLARTVEKLHLFDDDQKWTYSDKGIKKLKNCLKVRPIPGSRLIDIIGIADTGPKAAAIANQVTAAFIETTMATQQAANERMSKRARQQVKQYDEEIAVQQHDISRFRKKHQITGADNALAAAEGRIRQLETERSQLQMKQIELQTRQNKLKSLLSTGNGLRDDDSFLPEFLSNQTINSLRQKFNKLKDEESQLTHVYLPGHQKLRSVRLRIAETEMRIMEGKYKLIESMLQAATEQYTANIKRQEVLTEMLHQQKSIGVELTERHQHYQQLLKTLEMSQRLKGECLAKIRTLQMQKEMSDGPVLVIDTAPIPSEPVGLSKTHRAGSILLLGMLFSISFVFALERFSANPQATPARQQSTMFAQMPSGTAEQMMWWPGPMWPGGPAPKAYPNSTDEKPAVLAQLSKIHLGANNTDTPALKARCSLAHTDQASPEAASFRQISTKLLLRFGSAPQSIVVTSNEPSSGKTTTACNLAFLLAQAGRKVLLVDANTINPTLKHVFDELTEGPGLTDVLPEPDKLEQAFTKTDTPNLTVMPCGDNLDSTDLNHELSMGILHNKLRQLFDWVIYDSGTMDNEFTCHILRVVGKTLCLTGSTIPAELSSLAEQIEHLGAVNLGLIENYHAIKAGVSETLQYDTS